MGRVSVNFCVRGTPPLGLYGKLDRTHSFLRPRDPLRGLHGQLGRTQGTGHRRRARIFISASAVPHCGVFKGS